ncbi:alpha/beta fold hydrolase [Streptacidiphilus anmyonensis]|uniref:alpha/beta fold hydrolase n=1 Tax=Streptacidiphilus anmyonensis TaxID=405782 RepID=UPI000694F381|nr:alpha/beta hydrolase [Streptacidiphilus anmyonensis]
MTVWDGMVKVRGGEVWARDTGGDGPPLVLLHPGIGHSAIWDELVPPLAERFRVIRYDMRGYGRSPRATAPYALVDDLEAVLDHFGVRRASLVGCSMGGGTAMTLALAAPERVASMVLLCPSVPGYPWPEEPELEAEYDALKRSGAPDVRLTFALRVWAAAGADERVFALMRSSVATWEAGEFEQEDETVFERLGQVEVPSVLLVGDLDRAALVAANQEAARRIPGCELTLLPGVDHYLPLRAPELVVEAVIRHCLGRPSGSD